MADKIKVQMSKKQATIFPPTSFPATIYPISGNSYSGNYKRNPKSLKKNETISESIKELETNKIIVKNLGVFVIIMYLPMCWVDLSSNAGAIFDFSYFEVSKSQPSQNSNELSSLTDAYMYHQSPISLLQTLR